MTIVIPLPIPSTSFAADIVGTSTRAPQSRLPRAKRARPDADGQPLAEPGHRPHAQEDPVEGRDAPGQVRPDHLVGVALDPLADDVAGDVGQDERLVDRRQDRDDGQRRQDALPPGRGRRGRSP